VKTTTAIKSNLSSSSLSTNSILQTSKSSPPVDSTKDVDYFEISEDSIEKLTYPSLKSDSKSKMTLIYIYFLNVTI
jgi:hypothetical protein